ncbi:putative entry exclusion protein TrbK-alt [Bradyrhizobium sp.]|uniref:putative entry exclusion protein TrbK-alt n=1 Tax=Bradyrhizobium sp. TaxID=376 RepID=UPI001DFC60D0|nr:putative entry exclusion protein TrbK-alt [Bradyrhizobium sp.]MBI5317821.1 putative entry exclusion protein TrbK-alt [Bradyrhizobium sp.]
MSEVNAFKALSLGVTILVAVLAAACTIPLRDEKNQLQPASSVVREPDPVAAELERCRSISYEQKDRLSECRKVWAEQRRQFLRQNSDPPRNPAQPDPDATSSASFKDQSRLLSGLSPAPKPTER